MEEKFAHKVQLHINQLKNNNLRTIEKKMIQDRINWLNQYLQHEKKKTNYTPQDAFELLFFKKMKLHQDDLPIVKETNKEIVWLSHNRCQTLEACNSLGLDTKKVCRSMNEKATQAFLSRIDPQLRFNRSYREIRPYTEYCKEKIYRIHFDHYMNIAIQEAQISIDEGNKGYGAVVVFDDQIVGQAHDTTFTEKDPCLHAELKAIRQAIKKLNDNNLCGTILFSTCEPCPMCSSLAVWANITTIVYGISIQETAALGRSRIQISSKQIIEHSPCFIEVFGNILHDDCKALYL
jgi:tRNA(Arg) A34 adenosine deaminase TadA